MNTIRGKAKIFKTIHGISFCIKQDFKLKYVFFLTVSLLFNLVCWRNFYYKKIKKELYHFISSGFEFVPILLLFLILLFISLEILSKLIGKEALNIEKDVVYIEKTMFNIGFKKKFDRTKITNFRVQMLEKKHRDRIELSFWLLEPGNIKFDYQNKTYTFGHSIDFIEAHYIVKLIKNYIP